MIVDSSSLIIFAKINKLKILLDLYNNISITQEIYKETVKEGEIIDSSDSKIIKEFIDSNKIKIIDLNKEYENFFRNLDKRYSQLGCGESSAIALALQEKERIIIMDERLGRKVCKLYDITPKGTLRVLLEAFKRGIINELKLKEIIKNILENKFRIGADVINEFWVLFEKIKRGRLR